jgi:hypothetical protein
MEAFIVFAMVIAVVYGSGWALWRVRKVIWAAVLFVGALFVLGTWAAAQQTVPALGAAIASVGVLVGAWKFMKKRMINS